MISSKTKSDIVKWYPGSYFDLPENFKTGQNTCSKTTVIFDETLKSVVLVKGEHSVGSIIFPLNGELILDETVIYFGEDNDDVNCTKETSNYDYNFDFAWNEADVWSAERFNKATPDAERMPCSYDTVVFSKDFACDIDLPTELQYVKEVIIENEKYTDIIGLESGIYNSDDYTFIFDAVYELSIKFSETSCKPLECVCQEHPLEVDCSLKYCPKPLCDNAIQPIGHCCPICGSSIVISIESTFNTNEFVELVKGIIASHTEDLVYHIGRISKSSIQVVIVDRWVYTAASAEIANEIAYKLKGTHVNSKLTFYSGAPLSDRGLGAKIAFSMLFLVTVVMGGIYLYYYRMPQISFSFFADRHLSRTIGMSRFQRRTESVVTLTRRDSTVSSAPINTSFRNPLYESSREMGDGEADDDRDS